MKAFPALLAICARNSPNASEFPAKRPVTRSFDVFFDLRLNKRLSKQSWGWWFETLLRPLWRHNNGCSGLRSICYSTGLDQQDAWAPTQYRYGFPRYGNFLVKDKTVARPFNPQHGDPHTGKAASLYRDGLLLIIEWRLEISTSG